MRIDRIKINNIKGIDQLVIEQPIEPNRPNIIVAPNGFGKTSIATAFKSIKNGHIELDAKDIYNSDNTRLPNITINLSNGQSYSADNTHDDISNEFDVFVANSPLKPRATVQIFGGRSKAHTYMDIEPTVIMKDVPQRVLFDYDYASIKRLFGDSRKVLPSIAPLFHSYDSLKTIENKDIDFHTFDLRPYNKNIELAIGKINDLHKFTADKISKQFDDLLLGNIECPDFVKLCDIIKQEMNLASNLDAFLAGWQYVSVRKSMKSKFCKAVNYVHVIETQEQVDLLLAKINPVADRYNIVSKVVNGSLIIQWPEANMISGGQRDSMVFISKLLECKFRSTRDSILIIDEFFDYLDDANIVVFQYYVSTLIDSFKRSKKLIFPILLTHLDPNYLKHFCFNEKRLNVCYLKPSRAKISPELVKLVMCREQKTIKDTLDQFYFHYNPQNEGIDITADFIALGLNKDWATPSKFLKKIFRQLRAYLLEPEKPYDPLAICFAVRTRVEELAYLELKSEDQCLEFLDTHGTIEKLQYAQNKGALIPESYYLLGIVYNHPLHEVSVDSSRQLAMKLDNPSLMRMVRSLWP